MHTRSVAAIAITVSLVAAACSSTSENDDTSSTPSTTSTPTSTTPTTTTTSSAVEPSTTTDGPSVAAPPSPAVEFSGEWLRTEVGRGVKPRVALDAEDRPAIAYLLEDREGFVAFASSAAGWVEERVANGYFYGPIGLAFDPDGKAVVAYHDHQDTEFKPELGDLVVATRSDTGWSNETATDDGHDGWDSTVAISPDGTVHAAGIDPQQFDGEDGVEYYVRSGSRWKATPIGSGPIEYEWNVSLAIRPDGQPALTYFDNNTMDLRFAERIDNSWSIETVVEAGDVGRFSSLAIDEQGTPHISFYEKTGETTGIIRYATRVDGTWVTEIVGELSSVFIGFAGARRITSLSLHPNGAPVIAYSDQSGVFVATRDPGGWSTTTVATADDFAPGQLVDLTIDAAGTPHLATFAVTNEAPLDGTVIYLTTSG